MIMSYNIPNIFLCCFIYETYDFNPICKKTYGELYDETIKRELEIKNLNYNLITIWESDYNLNK
jgi:hypothetical protein